jgi:hypothetical protein
MPETAWRLLPLWKSKQTSDKQHAAQWWNQEPAVDESYWPPGRRKQEAIGQVLLSPGSEIWLTLRVGFVEVLEALSGVGAVVGGEMTLMSAASLPRGCL